MIESRILVVDDNVAVLKTLRRVLASEFSTVVTVHDPTVLPALLREGEADVVLLDMNFSRGSQSGSEGLFWLNRILGVACPPAVVVMTAYEDVGLAVSSFKKGAVDFIIKPWENEKLVGTIKEAVERRRLNSKKEEAEFDFPDYLLKKYARLYARKTPSLTPEGKSKLVELVKSGEIELLDNCIEQAVLLSRSGVLTAGDFRIDRQRQFPPEAITLEEMEKRLIGYVLKENRRNMVVCADILKISRQTLYNKIKKYHL